jgi:putative flippase GtrA
MISRINAIASGLGISVRLQDWGTEALRVARFGLVGLLSALVYATISAGSHYFIRNMMVATVVGQIASTTVSYLGHVHFSFGVHPQHRIFLSRFLFVVGVAFAMNIASTWFLSSIVPVPYQLSILVVMVLIPLVTYLASRFWVFLPGLAGRQVLPSIEGERYPDRSTSERERTL